LFFFIMAAALIAGCKKDEDKAYYLGGTQPKLASSSNAIHMQATDSVKTVLTLKWNDPGYKFSTGTSTLNVVHTLDVALSGTGFEDKISNTLENVLQVASTKMLVTAFTGDEFNDILISLGMQLGVSGSIDVRVSSSMYWDAS